jgi:hypothetical protein
MEDHAMTRTTKSDDHRVEVVSARPIGGRRPPVPPLPVPDLPLSRLGEPGEILLAEMPDDDGSIDDEPLVNPASLAKAHGSDE